MRSHAPFEPIVTKFCLWGRVVDVITDAKILRATQNASRVLAMAWASVRLFVRSSQSGAS